MQVGRTDDAVDCKSNHAVETPHPDADYLPVPLLMITVKLLCWCVVVRRFGNEEGCCRASLVLVQGVAEIVLSTWLWRVLAVSLEDGIGARACWPRAWKMVCLQAWSMVLVHCGYELERWYWRMIAASLENGYRACWS